MTTTDPLLDRQLGNFRIERPLGRGGMGRVYLGWDLALERHVAIKVISSRYQGEAAYARRFLQEARAIAAWNHPHIVRVFSAGQEDGLLYYVMEYLRGETLRARLLGYAAAGELMPGDEVLRIGEALASALDYAHDHGVIHRDVKPENVLLTEEGRIVLTDFGLALRIAHGSQGEVFGTAHYTAPEQARRSSQAVPQSDLYSLGVMLYEMLTGAVPFDDPSPAAVALQHITLPPPSPRSINPALNQQTESVLLRALQKAPSDRYPSGEALMQALRQALQAPAPYAADQNVALPPMPAAIQTNPPPPPPPKADPLIGQSLGQYRIEALRGQGGMARVYRGYDTRARRPVAIKVIDFPFQNNPDYLSRFQREAEAISKLKHPNIVKLYHYGQSDGLFYIAMQYIEGVELSEYLARHTPKGQVSPPPEVLLPLLRQICAALDYMHKRNIIHRDLSPANIMVTSEGKAMLTDFGLALHTSIGTRGEAFGSPHYVAPEQAVSSANAVAQSDLYALGVILYQAFTGHTPFEGGEPLELAMQHITNEPLPPRSFNPDLSPEIEAFLLKALAKEPEERFPSGKALYRALRNIWRPSPKRPRLLLPFSALLIAAFALGGWLLGNTPEMRARLGLPPAAASPPGATPFQAAALPAGAAPAPSHLPTETSPAAMPAASDTPLPSPTAAPTASDTPPPSPTAAPTASDTPPPSPTTAPTASDTPPPSPTAAPTASGTPLPGPAAAPAASDTPLPSPTAAPLLTVRSQDSMPMVLIPGGAFTLGASADDAQAELDERPAHEVRLGAYYIDRYEVSVAQFAAFLRSLGSHAPSACLGYTCARTKLETVQSHIYTGPAYNVEAGFEKYPVNNVTWYGAQAYCAWVGGRLPTEAEWEFAARGADGRIYPWGATPPQAGLAVFGQSRYDALQPVDSLPEGASAFGLFHMSGNVWEWTLDAYQPTYATPAAPATPVPALARVARALRGGSWQSPAAELRASNRRGADPLRFDEFGPDVGFRCVVEAPGQP